jgi:formamidopyrimidine-DNA glycosylase
MSVELPEARILAVQMAAALRGRQAKSVELRDCEKLQRMGFVNRKTEDFEMLVGRTVAGVSSRGNTVRVSLDRGVNLLLAPEYGGLVLFHGDGREAAERRHLMLSFDDGAALTVRLTSMGLIQAVRDGDLSGSYMYRRDFMGGLSPLEDVFTLDRFTGLVSGVNRGLKQVLVGKDAVLVGLSNSAFMDVIYRARLHPGRRGSSLSAEEAGRLFEAVKDLVGERMTLGGKDEWVDLHGVRGKYTPRMGPNMRGRACPVCGSEIERIQHGGGAVYLCPVCQV